MSVPGIVSVYGLASSQAARRATKEVKTTSVKIVKRRAFKFGASWNDAAKPGHETAYIYTKPPHGKRKMSFVAPP
jgi:hypothetical protein